MPDRIRKVGHWWIVRGRHNDGFHRFDAMNMSETRALHEADRLLPTIPDTHVGAMWMMLCDWALTPTGAGDSVRVPSTERNNDA